MFRCGKILKNIFKEHQMEEKVIKPHLVKPLLERVIYEKLQSPQNGVMVNIRPEDVIDVKKSTRKLLEQLSQEV